MITFTLLLLFCILCYYYLLKFKYSFWSRMGVKGPTPLPIVGNFGKCMIMQQSLDELARKSYVQYSKEKVVGLYCGFRQVIVIRDPNIIRYIVKKDFKSFMSRGVRTNEEGFCNNLLISEGEIWTFLRQKLTPAFTSTKLKQMNSLMLECVDKLITETESRIDNNPCDIKDLCEKYALDIICSCIFGLSLDVYSKEMKHFGVVSKVATQPSIYIWFWYVAEMIFPGIQSKFVQINSGAYLRDFFTKLVTTVINERESRGIKRNDMMNLMINLKAQDKLKVVKNSPLEIKIDDNVIASQAFAFYVAGQETSSSVLSFLLYELSLHPEVQDKVYNEICRVCDNCDGNLTYDSLKEMNYLYMVFRETMRKYPAIGFILRQATSDYNIPESTITIKAKTLVLISLTGLHGDTKYFKNPETFNPDNFSEKNITKIPQYTYMPFGAGPRNCIGFRLAEMHILMAVVTFLNNFILEPCNGEKYKIKFNNTNSITLAPKDGIFVNLFKREK